MTERHETGKSDTYTGIDARRDQLVGDDIAELFANPAHDFARGMGY